MKLVKRLRDYTDFDIAKSFSESKDAGKINVSRWIYDLKIPYVIKMWPWYAIVKTLYGEDSRAYVSQNIIDVSIAMSLQNYGI